MVKARQSFGIPFYRVFYRASRFGPSGFREAAATNGKHVVAKLYSKRLAVLASRAEVNAAKNASVPDFVESRTKGREETHQSDHQNQRSR